LQTVFAMISFVPPVNCYGPVVEHLFPSKVPLLLLRGSRFGTGGLYTKPAAQRQAFRRAEE